MNHSPQEVEEIGGIRYLYKYLGVYLPYMILMSVGTVAGIIGIVWTQTFGKLYLFHFQNFKFNKGNTLIILAVAFSNELKTITNALIVNLAVSDILIASFSNSFSAVGK